MDSSEPTDRNVFPDAVAQDLQERMVRRIGELALKEGFITHEQLNECLKEQAQSSEKFPLAQILLARKHITPQQFAQLLEAHNRYLLVCQGCGKGYQIMGFRGQALWCLDCGRELILASAPQDLMAADQQKTPYRTSDEDQRQGLWIGAYQVVREIARGGMGVVFEAFDPELKRRIALKVLKDDQMDIGSVKRLHREAALAGRLRHPNIVTVYEVGVADQTHYIAMELIDGQTLAARIKEGPLPIPEAVALLKTAAEAVACAHSQRVVHRDLKPGNIILDPERGPIVMDFGLAKDQIEASGITLAGSIMGTPNYMAPEQIDGRECGPESDVHALGVILYELLTRQHPYEGSTLAELQHRILYSEPIPPRRLCRTIDADLETICLKCLAKLPAWRYPSARELAEDLGHCLRGEPIQARPVGFNTRLLRKIRRNWKFSAALGLAAAVALGSMAEVLSSSIQKARHRAIREEIQPVYQKAQLLHERFQQELHHKPGDLRPAHREIEEAILRIGQALQKDPAFSEARLLRGELLLHLNRFDAAREDFREVIRQTPSFLKAYVSLIRLGIRACIRLLFEQLKIPRQEVASHKALSDRMTALQKELSEDVAFVLKLASDNDLKTYFETFKEFISEQRRSDALVERCDRHAEQGQYALEYAQMALVILATRAYEAGTLEAYRKLLPEMIRRLEELRQVFRRDQEIYRMLDGAYALASFEEYQAAAISLYTDWITLLPDLIHPYLCRARCFQKIQKFDEAERDYRQAAAIDPKKASPLVSLAWMYLEGFEKVEPENIARTEGYLEEALARDPDEWSAYHARYTIRFRQGRYEEALKDISRAIDLHNHAIRAAPPVDALIPRLTPRMDEWWHGYLLRARVENRLEHYDMAIRDATRVLDHFPDLRIPAYEERAFAQYLKGAFDPALEDCNRLLQDHPASWPGRKTRALIHLRCKRFQEALEDAAAFKELLPESVEARLLKVEAHTGLEQVEQGLQELEEALDLLPKGHSLRPSLKQQRDRLRASPPDSDPY